MTSYADQIVAAARGDESAFTVLVGRYRRELQLHAYRIVGSYEESEDLTQETFLRAWRMRESFQGRSSLRTWLYQISTNTCLTALEQQTRRRHTHEDELASLESADADPDAELVSKEAIELALLVAVRRLPPRQRVVLIVRDVLGWSAKEAAALLEMSVAAANSALQRARATLREHLPRRELEWTSSADLNKEERALLGRYVDAVVRADSDALVATLVLERGR